MISKHESIYPKKFDMFYSIIKEHFLKNNETLVKYLEGKMVEYPDSIHLTTDLYSMSVSVDYKKLYKNYIKIMNDIGFASGP
jgi:hypothetical protein